MYLLKENTQKWNKSFEKMPHNTRIGVRKAKKTEHNLREKTGKLHL